MRDLKGKKAQTAVELAVFGSILIFMLGMIVRSIHGKGSQQHSLLKATRYAMMMSHTTTEEKEVAGRNMASVLLVEDRLTAASSKYGAVDRMPLMSQGSAVHSANLFMPIDFGDDEDLPQFDLFVNGQHFAFTSGKFRDIPIANKCAGASSCHWACADGGVGATNCDSTSPFYYPPTYDYNQDGVPEEIEWEPNCVEGEIITVEVLPCADITRSYPPWTCPPGPQAAAQCRDPVTGQPDCSNISELSYTIITTEVYNIGCARLYTIVDNHPLIEEWCDDGPALLGRACLPDMPDCATTPQLGCNLPVDERFDLDRDDLDGLAGDITVPANQRAGFAWQWFLVLGYNEKWETTKKYTYSTSSLSTDTTFPSKTVTRKATFLQAQGIVLPGGEHSAKNVTLDVDLDLKQEYIMSNVDGGAKPNDTGKFGVITRLGVQDSQEGDLDFSYNDSDALRGEEPYGFTRDTNVYTMVNPGDSGDEGTYLQINEGRLYSASGQFIRTASKKDSVDLIERIFRLSNNTGAYCGGQPLTSGGNAPVSRKAHPNNLEVNPVEVCSTSAGGCFTPGNIFRTCMDVPNNLIFIRSRIEDLHGRAWTTDVNADPYVDFVIE